MDPVVQTDLRPAEVRRRKLRDALAALKTAAPRDAAEAAPLLLGPLLDSESLSLAPPHGSTPFVVFVLAGVHYAGSVASLREVGRLAATDPVTELPAAPDWLLGLINRHGVILPLLDLRRRAGLPPAPSDPRRALLVVSLTGDAGSPSPSAAASSLVGLLVDQFRGLAHLYPERIKPTDPTGTALPLPPLFLEAYRGHVTHAHGPLVVLDLERLLRSPGFRSLSRESAVSRRPQPSSGPTDS